MSLNQSLDTIYALSTAPGKAGVAVIRLSGPQSGAALQALCGSVPRPRRLARRDFRDPITAAPIDTGMAVLFPAPASFTGEDCAELHCHGSRAVIAALLAALAQVPGLRIAEPGEFTRRAFRNGRLDLTEAEGLADLLAAETEAQRQLALQIASGGLRLRVEDWRTRLIGQMALIEALLDFSDEGDIGADVIKAVPAALAELADEMAAVMADHHRSALVREGFRVVLAGAPNAGKSSLLNALARRDVAIVSAEPGTTRDVIDVRLDLAGLPVIISDTAGLRQAEGAIEQEGMRRTLAAAGVAELVLWLVDYSAPELEPPVAIREAGVPILTVINKIDLGCAARPLPGLPPETLQISALRGTGLALLLERIKRAAQDAVGSVEAILVTHERQRLALRDAHAAIITALSAFPRDLELRAEDLRTAAHALGRLTGRVDIEDVLDQVFSTFCIGK